VGWTSGSLRAPPAGYANVSIQEDMILTKRTTLSLCQFLDLFSQDVIHILFEKHNIRTRGYSQLEISWALPKADKIAVEALIDEIVATNGDLRNRVSPRYRFDERWEDFCKCMLLDGFKIKEKEVLRLEPVIEVIHPLEDDLTKEIELSSLASSDKIIQHIKLSAESFRKSTPDFNACLSHARIALETIVRDIACSHAFEITQDSKAWGKSLSHIKTVDFVTNKEEHAISSVYTFVSEGAHIPVGFTEEEFVRFGRNLAMAVCYFIIKKFNG